ncbi:hypothetical protein Mro03_77790 [Microbispora rosea subsp. rosea]|nr:hypothetical protein Mro03_77790 [Microbispora rosea subsp. rosea]
MQLLSSFGLRALSVLAPQGRPHALAGILHLGTGDVGVTLCRRDAGVAEDLLHDADVDALLGEERSRRVSRCMESGFPDPGLAEECLPLRSGIVLTGSRPR